VTSSRSERLLAPDYLGDLSARPIEEIRAMRAECQEVEVGLSYVRRLVQGRLDILGAEIRHRAASSERSDLASLVEDLPSILADHTHAPGVGRLSKLMAPSDDVENEMEADLEQVVSADEITRANDLTEDQIRDVLERLTVFEHTVSATRHSLHERIDALQAELTRRYKSGEATVDSLLN
jgi:hypothetical protein